MNYAHILEAARVQLSDIMPADWAEQHRVMDETVSPAFPGPFRYDNAPYLREIVNRLHPSDPVKHIAVMKAGQIGYSAGVIENGVGWIIAQNPAPILSLVGHESLLGKTMIKIDQMIDSTGLRPLIRTNSKRPRGGRTGDTNLSKEFPRGNYDLAIANHKSLRGNTYQTGFIDDYEAMKGRTKESGSTEKMILQRFNSTYSRMKLFWSSTPELEQDSNILYAFNKGDKRYWYIPCQRCHEHIPLKWSIDIEGTNEKAGIFYKPDKMGRVDVNTVCYICPKCGQSFDDRNKYQFLIDGKYVAEGTAINEEWCSYHIGGLYAPYKFFPWKMLVREYVEANPFDQPRKEAMHQTFMNLQMGYPYTQEAKETDAKQLLKNTRPYDIGVIPENLSIKDGNGPIVLVTLAADMNGTVADAKKGTYDDARLDWKLAAWAQNGVQYDLAHGSIGTFVPGESPTEKAKSGRIRWTYEEHKPRSVWPEFEALLNQVLVTDSGRKLKIDLSGLDCGHYTQYAETFLEKTNVPNIVGLKGDKEHRHIATETKAPYFKSMFNRVNMYVLPVGQIKDDVAHNMNLNWDELNDPAQPSGFMNFPQPANGSYQYPNYYAHYEAEMKEVKSNADGVSVSYLWKKRDSTKQNHQWDCQVYNVALTHIYVGKLGKEQKIKDYSWRDFAEMKAHMVKEYLKKLEPLQ